MPEPLRPLVAAGMAKKPEDRPADATTFVSALNAIASGAYGPDWAERGRSHLGEAALLLAAAVAVRALRPRSRVLRWSRSPSPEWRRKPGHRGTCCTSGMSGTSGI